MHHPLATAQHTHLRRHGSGRTGQLTASTTARRHAAACPRSSLKNNTSKHNKINSTRVNNSSGSSDPAHPTATQQEATSSTTTTDRLFSNLNPRSLQHEPGSVWGSALLVSGTAIGAGILALPAVTQEAGFVPSAAVLTAVCGFSIATGLLVAEVSLRLMQQQGAGSVSMIGMAKTTLGNGAAVASSAAYVFLHYALLVAYMSKAGEIVFDATGLPLAPSAACFALAFGAVCYLSSQQLLDKLNGGLVGLVVACFLGLLVAAAPGVDAGSLTQQGDWAAVPATLPVVALAFVYHNVVPVVVQALEGDARKVRTAVCAGVAIPWVMFVTWEAAILGSVGQLQAVSGAAVSEVAGAPTSAQQVQETQLVQAGRLQGQDLGDSSSSSDAMTYSVQIQQAPQLDGQRRGAPDMSTASSGTSSSSTVAVADPLAALSASNPSVGPLVQAFSFLAIATSFIGFILGLTDFVCDGLALPSRQAPIPYLLTLLPPYMVAVTNPNIFLSALDTAGTYGVLTLFGILPAAMAWSSRQSASAAAAGDAEGGSGSINAVQLLPGGTPMLVAVGSAATCVIVYSSVFA